MLSLTAPCRENSKGIRTILWKKYQNLSCHKDMILLSTDHTDDRVWWVKRWHGGGGGRFETKTNHYFKYLLITMRNIWTLRVVSVKGSEKIFPTPPPCHPWLHLAEKIPRVEMCWSDGKMWYHILRQTLDENLKYSKFKKTIWHILQLFNQPHVWMMGCHILFDLPATRPTEQT